MGVQRQQERRAFLHDAHPCMPVPVDVSLVPFGLPKPTLQIQVVLEAWQRASTDEEACGTAGHHPRHVVVKRRAVYLSPADKSHRLTRRLSKGQKGLEERALLASQRPSEPW